MKILAIETSCDDTAVSIVEVKGSLTKPVFKVLANNISSQIKIHRAWGGVVPSLAKREHSKNLAPLLIKSLKDANLFSDKEKTRPNFAKTKLSRAGKILERELELRKNFLQIIAKLKIPKIDAIAVTKGPGLEPALWVGINFAKALAWLWDKPLYPVNHLEGHILVTLASPIKNKIRFPLIALIVSGGHTELVLSKDWLKYKIIGRTRDDAAGEAFDKVARILDLPYPGGPEISKLAQKISAQGRPASSWKLPRPMLHSGDFDFSFSGLKTAVLYLAQKLKSENKFTEKTKAEIAFDFQESVIEVLTKKTLSACQKYKAKTIIAGGGVIANTSLRDVLQKMAEENQLQFLIPDLSYSTDNATMIALAAGLRFLASQGKISRTFKAEGNLSLK